MSEDRKLPPTRWERFGDHHLMFTEPDTLIPAAVWDAVLDDLDDPSLRGCLSIVGGDGFAKLDKAQWSRASRIVEAHRFPVAVIASHRITRAMVTASSWFGANVRAYKWAELDEALRFLGVPVDARPAASAIAERLRAGTAPAD